MADITSNLEAYLKLDETSGTSAADDTGNGHTGFHSSSPTVGATGKIGLCVDYSGASTSNTVVAAGSTSIQPTDTLTFALWFKAASLDGNYNLLGGNTPANGTSGYGFYYDPIGNLYFFINNYASGPHVAFTADGAWHHLVGTYDKNAGSNQAKLYVDGSLAAQMTYTTAIGYGDAIGRINRGDGGGFAHAPALIDEVRIYSRALTAGDVTDLYAYSGGGGGGGTSLPFTNQHVLHAMGFN
jgi:hypothetical protein